MDYKETTTPHVALPADDKGKFEDVSMGSCGFDFFG